MRAEGESGSDSESPSDNSIAEKHIHPNSDYTSLYGGFYSWNETTDYGRDLVNGICPEGWRLPLIDDINRIKGILWFTKNYSSYVSVGGSFNLDLPLSGKYILTAKTWDSQGYSGNFWMNHEQAFPKFVTWVIYQPGGNIPYEPKMLTDYNPLVSETVLWNNLWGNFTYHKVALPIRCIKDHEIN